MGHGGRVVEGGAVVMCGAWWSRGRVGHGGRVWGVVVVW